MDASGSAPSPGRHTRAAGKETRVMCWKVMNVSKARHLVKSHSNS